MVLLSLILTSAKLVAQCKEWQWPDDRKMAEEKVILLQDAVRQKNYKDAISPLNWLIENTPKINYSIYVHGANIYDALASSEKDAIKKEVYIDSLMTIYDMRMSQCGDQSNVLARKAMGAFKYWINSPKYASILPVMDSVFTLYPESASDVMLLYYMQAAIVNRHKADSPDDEGLLRRFDRISEMVAQRIKSSIGDAKRLDQLKKVQSDVEAWLFKVIKPDCDFAKAKLAPSFRKTPNDVELAKKIFAFMLQGKCADEPLWLEAATVVFHNEKDYGLGKNIGLRLLSLELYDSADRYMDLTMPLASKSADSSELYFYKGLIASANGKKPIARKLFLRSLELNPGRTDAAEKIGDLYYASFNDCAERKIQADDRAVYLAAYKWYAKAGNEKKMEMAQESFPSREEIFLVNYKKGDTMSVDCWIDEQVVIQTRD